MCAINGIFSYGSISPEVSREELLRTRDHMTTRGPDGCAIWMSDDERVGLAHRRLAIIDLSDLGAQPMSSSDGRLWVTFNGEIYNYRELREQLSAEGVNFRSRSDTEVLLHLYRRDGEAMVHRLRGMFAFAIWDADERSLFLARDPYGIKPLYYSDDGRVFRFASQVRALLAGKGIAHEADPAGTVGFLLWGSVPEPFTMYKHISALPAGTTMRVGFGGAAAPRPYWDLAQVVARSCASARDIPKGEEGEHVREALLDSVRAHMVADVPVGAFLSAGLDSSTIVGLAQEASGATLEAITLTFDEFQGLANDELPIARKIAQHLGVRHHCVSVSMAQVEADIPRFMAAMDQPTVDGVNTWFVSKAAAQEGLKVALSGLGGDELFGGYASFADIPRRVHSLRGLSKVPGLGEAFRRVYCATVGRYGSLNSRNAGLIRYGGNFLGAYQLQRGIFMPWELDQVLDHDFARAGLQRLEKIMTDNCAEANLTGFGKVVVLESSHYMRNQLLRDTDWTSMSHSLEIRVPLVDCTLTERVVGLAATGRLGESKQSLPRSLKTPLPDDALRRPKTGFTVPLWKWLRHSAEFDAWKRIAALKRPNVRDYNRWAYTVISRIPEVQGLLK